MRQERQKSTARKCSRSVREIYNTALLRESFPYLPLARRFRHSATVGHNTCNTAQIRFALSRVYCCTAGTAVSVEERALLARWLLAVEAVRNVGKEAFALFEFKVKKNDNDGLSEADGTSGTILCAKRI